MLYKKCGRRAAAVMAVVAGMTLISGCGLASSSNSSAESDSENETAFWATDETTEETDENLITEETGENLITEETDENLVTDEEMASVGNYLDNLDLEVWDGSVAESYAGGSGTESDPYQISNGAELALFAEEINHRTNESCYFVLTSDIQLNDLTDWENWLESAPANIFTSIGESNYPTKCFSGVFDGQHHTIYGYYSTNGLFTCLEYGGTIKNLTLDASVINGENETYTGGFVDEIIKYNNQKEYETVIQSCSFNGIIQGSGCVGGIVGSARSGASIIIKNCKNSADISGGNYAGGIIGSMIVESGGGNEIVRGCENYGDISAGSDAGGIIGDTDVQNGAEGSLVVDSCRNTGSTTSTGEWYNGGIIGLAGVGAGETSSVYNCVNSAEHGVIDGFSVGADGTLTLSNNFYQSGSLAYNTAQKSYIYGTLNETNLIDLTTDAFRGFNLPIYPDAEEALDTGDYVKYNGKIYYQGYSGRLFCANYDGTQEEEVAASIYAGTDYIGYDNCLYYLGTDGDYNFYIASYNMDTGEESCIADSSEDSIIFLTVEDGVLYYEKDYAAQIIKYTLSDGTEETVDLENVNGEMSIQMAEDLIAVSYLYWDEDTGDTSLIYNFYTLDGDLIREVDPQEFGDEAVMSLIDSYMLIYAGDKIMIYDPVSGEITEENDFTDGAITYFYSMNDEYIYVHDYDGNYYRISRADGSSKKF